LYGSPDLTLPYNQHLPAHAIQLATVAAVTRYVLLEFIHPELVACFWFNLPKGTSVAVPETTMHEDNPVTTWENQVWASGQASYMETVACSQHMRQPTHYDFRRRVFSSDVGHAAPSLLWRKHVAHFAGPVGVRACS
jgi:hypothetical protein